MNKAFKMGIMITLSISALAGCAGNVATAPSGTASTSGFVLRADGTAASSASAQPGDFHGGKGMKGGRGGEHGLEGLSTNLNLTADQKTQLEALRQADKPANPPDRTQMDAVRKAINDAFISDNFDAAALKAQADALKPQANTDDRLKAEAGRIIKTYNILTPEQRTILETNQAAMAARVPTARPTPPADQTNSRLDKLATALGLSDAQKASLAPIMQPPARTDDEAAEQAKRKAAQDAVNAELKTGNATVDSIVAILKANAPAADTNRPNEIDRLAQIHAILNADQRTKFISLDKGFGFGPGGHGGHEGGHGGPGGKR
jgi:Spy/CpxP family protein refolding chaperone